MRVVQTELSATEHALLEAYVKARGTTIKEAVRAAIRRLTLPDQVDPKDPIFHAFPLTRKKARITDGSEHLDRYLYGRDE
jgi:hypothetical protein